MLWITDINPAAVVGDLQELQTALLDQYLEMGGASILGVLNELLQGVDRRNNNLPCCDLVDNIWIQGLRESLVIELS